MEFGDSSESANPNATGTRSTTIYDVPIFKYQPLDETKQQIRLLRLLKTRTSEKLRCDIVIHDLDTLPKYRALSYVWGCPQPTHPLLIQGKRLHIRQNLHRFLHEYPRAARSAVNRYRAPSYYDHDESGGLLWVDQICIDQSNVRERNHQVNLMSRIYKQCEYVITWIGDLDGSDVCSTAARDFTESFRSEALVPILCNPYFTRLWIIQELLLAPFVRVLVEGGEWLLWSDMQGALAHLSKDDMQQLQAARSVAAPLLRAQIKDRKRPRDLIQLFRDYHKCDCEDPRDKVFGLMGLTYSPLSFAGTPLNIQVDYTKSVHDTFSEVAVELHHKYGLFSLPEPREAEGPLKVLSDLGLSMGLDKVTVKNAMQIARKACLQAGRTRC